MNEKIPKGFVGRNETEELRRKLVALLAEKKAIALSTDKEMAEKLINKERRFTKYEAQFASDLWGGYIDWKNRIAKLTGKMKG